MIHLYRDSANPYTFTIKNKNTGLAADVSELELRFEFYQDGKTVTLTLGDGLSFVTDGSDGQVIFLMSKARVNQLCTGSARVRGFDDSGTQTSGDPIVIWEGSAVIEGRSFDA